MCRPGARCWGSVVDRLVPEPVVSMDGVEGERGAYCNKGSAMKEKCGLSEGITWL